MKGSDITTMSAKKTNSQPSEEFIYTQSDIDKIVNTYINREEIDKYSHRASLEEIKENDFNLNIPRYVDTFEEEEPVDLDEVCKELEKISEEMKEVDAEIKKYCDELGIKAPLF